MRQRGSLSVYSRRLGRRRRCRRPGTTSAFACRGRRRSSRRVLRGCFAFTQGAAAKHGARLFVRSLAVFGVERFSACCRLGVSERDVGDHRPPRVPRLRSRALPQRV